MKIIYCSGCHCKVAEIIEGSKIKKDSIMLCSTCEVKRKMSDLAGKGKKNQFDSLFGEIFG